MATHTELESQFEVLNVQVQMLMAVFLDVAPTLTKVQKARIENLLQTALDNYKPLYHPDGVESWSPLVQQVIDKVNLALKA